MAENKSFRKSPFDKNLLPSRAVLGGVTLCCAFLAGCSGQDTYSATDNEKALAHAMFGDKIKTSALKTRFSPQRINNPLTNEPMAAQVFDGETVHFYIDDYFSSDYASIVTRSFARLLYLHELTHIAQFQAHLDFTYCITGEDKTYRYSVKAGAKFEDYCMEQQASMIQDYAGLYFFDEVQEPFYMQGRNSAENNEWLQNIVENLFPEARRTRLKGGFPLAPSSTRTIIYRPGNIPPEITALPISMIFR